MEDKFGKNPKVSVRHRLDNFLLSYRITPQSSTGCSPYELLFKHAPRTRFSLLKPDVNTRVRDQQERAKVNHDSSNMKIREFFKGDKVMVQNFRGGKEKYVVGVIAKRLGPLTYLVKVGQKLRHCHVDHLLVAGKASFPSEQDTVLPQPEEIGSRSVPGIENGGGQIAPQISSPSAEANQGDKGTETASNDQTLIEKPAASPMAETSQPSVYTPERRYPKRMIKKSDRLIESM